MTHATIASSDSWSRGMACVRLRFPRRTITHQLVEPSLIGVGTVRSSPGARQLHRLGALTPRRRRRAEPSSCRSARSRLPCRVITRRPGGLAARAPARHGSRSPRRRRRRAPRDRARSVGREGERAIVALRLGPSPVRTRDRRGLLAPGEVDIDDGVDERALVPSDGLTGPCRLLGRRLSVATPRSRRQCGPDGNAPRRPRASEAASLCGEPYGAVAEQGRADAGGDVEKEGKVRRRLMPTRGPRPGAAPSPRRAWSRRAYWWRAAR